MVDKNGRVYYKELPSSSASKSTLDTFQSKTSRDPTVDLYVTNWCGYCRKAIAFLKAHGVPYTVYDIEKDRNAAKRKLALSGNSGVPFAMINGKKVYGFSQSTYKKALNIR